MSEQVYGRFVLQSSEAITTRTVETVGWGVKIDRVKTAVIFVLFSVIPVIHAVGVDYIAVLQYEQRCQCMKSACVCAVTAGACLVCMGKPIALGSSFLATLAGCCSFDFYFRARSYDLYRTFRFARDQVRDIASRPLRQPKNEILLELQRTHIEDAWHLLTYISTDDCISVRDAKELACLKQECTREHARISKMLERPRMD